MKKIQSFLILVLLIQCSILFAEKGLLDKLKQAKNFITNLNADFHFKGRVLNQYGDPVPYAKIYFALEYFSIRKGIMPVRTQVTLKTRQNGFFEFKGKGRALYLDKIEAEGCMSERMSQPRYNFQLIGDSTIGASSGVYNSSLETFFIWEDMPADVLTKGDSVITLTADGSINTYYNPKGTYKDFYNAKTLHDEILPFGNPATNTTHCYYKNKTDKRADLWISCVPSYLDGSYIYTFQVPNGGVMQYEDPDLFIAPKTGYQEKVDVEKKGDINLFAYKEYNGVKIYSRYILSTVSLFSYSNPYGSRNLQWSREVQGAFWKKEYGAREEMDAKFDEINKKQGIRAAYAYWNKENKVLDARLLQDHKNRRERSKKLMPIIEKLEEKRLAFKPLMERILKGEYISDKELAEFHAKYKNPKKALKYDATGSKIKPKTPKSSKPPEIAKTKTNKPLSIILILLLIFLPTAFILYKRKKSNSPVKPDKK